MSKDSIKIERGDVVRLSSGGPDMTVTSVGWTGWITCTWFDGNSNLQAANFQKDLLQIVRKQGLGE